MKSVYMDFRYESIEGAGVRICSMLKENLVLYQARPDNELTFNYVQFIDDIVMRGFYDCLQCRYEEILFQYS